MTFSFEFELSEPEQVRASRCITLRLRETRAALAFFILVGVVSLVHLLLGLTGRAELAWFTVAGLAMVPAGWFLVADWGPRRQIRLLRQRSRAAHSPHRYTLSERGLDASALGVESSTAWANVIEGVETKEFFLFFLSKGFAQVLPKAAVGPEELSRLREALRAWLSDRFAVQGHS